MRALPVVLLLAGCVAPGVYGSARTLAPGDHQWVLSMDALDDVDTFEDDGNLYPRVAYRRGLTRRLELGLQTAAYPTLGADLKVAVVQGRSVALAVAPTLAYSWVPDYPPDNVSWLELRLPFLVEVGLTDAWSISMLAGGGTAVGLDAEDGADLMVGGGAVGVRYRGDGFALHPTLGYFGALSNGAEHAIVSAGLALTLGDLAAPPGTESTR